MSDHVVDEPSEMQEPNVPPTAQFVLLDRALWQKFRNADSSDEFIETWLAILCRQIPGVSMAIAMLGEPDVGPFPPVAYWPEKNFVGQQLAAVADNALNQRQGVIMSAGVDEKGRTIQQLAYPLILNDRLYGIFAVAFAGQEDAVNIIMRKVQWAAGWVEVLLHRQIQAEDQELHERSRIAFDMLATVLENKRIRAAATALVTELAMRLGCDPVSIGFVRYKRCDVMAISHAAGFGTKMNLIRDIGAAMDEAVDQKAIIVYPLNEAWEYRVTRAHDDLAKANNNARVLTIPLMANQEIIGAITLQSTDGQQFDETTVDLCDAVAAVVGPVLLEKYRNDRNILMKILESIGTQLKRLLGANFFGRKLATIIFAGLVIFFSMATTQYTVVSPALVRGTIQRTIVAPFRSYVADEFARPGSIVKKGELLARLDDQDLTFERLRLVTTRQQKLTEYDRTLSKHDRAEALIIKTQVEQSDVQLSLIDEQIKRTRLTAPFDGFVVDGDLSQSIGAAVERGQELFKIAPLNSYRVILEVDEGDIEELVIGQAGILRVSSLPHEQMIYRIEQITAISDQKDGRNFFRVEAALETMSDRLRPGMEGIAKTEIEERLLIYAYTGKMIDWAYLTVWRWLP